MDNFEEVALRLKQELSIKTDKELAAALGLSAVAYVGRKNRGNFPEMELYTLAAKQPDLRIDVPYVLTGQRGGVPPAIRGQVDHLVAWQGAHGDERGALLASEAIREVVDDTLSGAEKVAAVIRLAGALDQDALDIVYRIVVRLVRAGPTYSGPDRSGKGSVSVSTGGQVGNIVQSHGNKNAPIKLTAVLPKNKDRGDRD